MTVGIAETETTKIEMAYTQNDRLVRTVDYKNRAAMMKIELTHTQNDRLVMSVVCSVNGIGGGNKGRAEMMKIGLVTD